jgi:hypothetical protein
VFKKIAGFSFLTTVFFLFSACGGEGPAPKNEQVKMLPQHLPGWVLSPRIKGYLSGVGHARPQKANPAYQRRVAMMQARAAIGRAIEVYVQTELTTEKTCIGEACRSEMRSRSRHLSEQLIGEATVKNEWIDPETGILYIRLIVKKEERKR